MPPAKATTAKKRASNARLTSPRIEIPQIPPKDAHTIAVKRHKSTLSITNTLRTEPSAALPTKVILDPSSTPSLHPASTMPDFESLSIVDFHRFLQPIIQREVDRIMDLERASWHATSREYEAKIAATAQHAVREKEDLGRALDDALEQVTKLRAVPFPLSLMRCNKCGKDLVEDEGGIYVADGCGAVSRFVFYDAVC
jgi:hypothetical protein